MRRMFAIFLLLLLPMQVVWGAAAQYCAHELQTNAVAHLGHHSHQHQADEEQAAKVDGPGGASSFHGDCASCHLATSAGLLGAAAEEFLTDQCRYLSDYAQRYKSHVPIGPERPDRPELHTAARFGDGVELRLFQN